MGKLYKFNNEDKGCMCEFCQLANEFVPYIAEVESLDEISDILRGLVSEASKLTLIDFLQKEVKNNVELLNYLVESED